MNKITIFDYELGEITGTPEEIEIIIKERIKEAEKLKGK